MLLVSLIDTNEAQVNQSTERATSPWLDTEEAAAYLKAKPGTLKNWRHRGEGPRYHIVNRRLVRYHRTELDAFALNAAS